MNISLDEKVVEKLQALAKSAGKSAEAMIADFVQVSLDEDERYRRAVRAGIGDADAGRLVDFDESFDRVTVLLKRSS